MYCMKPEEAKPIVYGMNTQGGDRITTIGAKTEYPDLCMEIINYFATPEGFMTYKYCLLYTSLRLTAKRTPEQR